MIKNPKLYFLEWHDAHSSSGWFYDKEAEDFIKKEKCIILQTGWLINETKDEIVIACRRMKIKQDGDSEWGMLQKIPKSWIKRKLLINSAERK